MSYDILKKQLKEGKLTKFLHFYGEERYLVYHYINIVKKFVVGDSEDFNLIVFEGDVSKTDIDMSFNTPPLMGECKLILLKDTGVFALKNENKAVWKTVFSNAADFAYVLAFEDKFDKRSTAYRAFAEKCLSVNFERRSQGDMKAWVSRLVYSAGKKMGNDAAQAFLDSAGLDMYSVEAGINKLISGVGNSKEITKENVTDIITKEYFTKEYAYTDAMLTKNAADANKYLGELLEMGFEPINLLFIVGSSYLSCYKAKLMQSDGESASEMIKRLKLPREFLARKFIGYAKKLSEEYLASAIELIKEADYKVKIGLVDPVTLIRTLTEEILILKD